MFFGRLKSTVNKQNIFLALLFVSAFLGYVIFSRHFTFWEDELHSVDYANQNIGFFISNYFASPDNHPPLYYFLLNIWQKIFNINFANDYLYKALSIVFHFLTVGFIAVFYLEDRVKRCCFVVLALISSFFLVFGQMARYYTMAAFFYIVTLFFFEKWLDSKNIKDLVVWLTFFIVLAYADYPSALFFAVTGLFLLFLRGWNYIKTVNWFQVLIGLGVTSLLLLPLLYLNAVYYYSFGSLGASDLGGNLSRFTKAIEGILFMPYHFLVGEYFNTVISSLLGIFLVYILVCIFKSYRLGDKVLYKKYLYIILVNIIFGSFFLTFFVGRYPIFSYARFLLPAAYLLLLLFTELFVPLRKHIIIAVIVVNIFTIYNNLNDQNFINPTYFYPQETSRYLADKSQFPILVGSSGYRGYSSADYFMQKNFFDRSVYSLNQVSGKFMVFEEPRLLSDISTTKKEIETQYGSKILDYGGYDNISNSNKLFMKKMGLMKSDYKYYYFVLQRNKD